MNTHLVLPVAGASTRFNGGRFPKFLLQHPVTHKTMLTSGIEGFPLDDFASIVIIYRLPDGLGSTPMEVFPDWQMALNAELKQICSTSVSFVGVDNTRNQPETVYLGLRQSYLSVGNHDSFLVKDCDSYYKIRDAPVIGSVMYAKLEEYPETPAANKSYIRMMQENKIVNLVEKRVIGSTFCVGGYAFQSAGDYMTTFAGMEEHIRRSPKLYLSHVIYSMMLGNRTDFFGVHVEDYQDWGTQKEWEKL